MSLVRLKPLVWEQRTTGISEAQTPIGFIRIEVLDGSWIVLVPNQRAFKAESEEQAKFMAYNVLWTLLVNYLEPAWIPATEGHALLESDTSCLCKFEDSRFPEVGFFKSNTWVDREDYEFEDQPVEYILL